MQIEQTIPASRKLQRDDAIALLSKAKRMSVAKGKKVQHFDGGKSASEDAIAAMLGSTGNLRAPTIVTGNTLLVGFNEDVYEEALG